MTDPGPAETTTADLSREFLARAYPDRPAEWIDQQVNEAVRRISEAGPQRQRQLVAAASSRRRRGLLWLAVAAAIVVAVVALREPIAAAVVRESGVVTLAVIAVLAAAVTIWMRVRERRAKVLSCRIRINSRFESSQENAVRPLELTGPDAAAIEDPGMVVVRIKNLGGTAVEATDYLAPLQLRFPGRRVRIVDITASDPPQLHDTVATHPDFRIGSDSITLPRIRLAPDESFNVVTILSGTKVGERYPVHIGGQLRSGRITPDSTIPWIRRRTIAGVGVTTLAAGALAVVLLLNNVRPFTALPQGLVCVPGSLTVEGSSAFAPAATSAAGEYNAYCPGSFIDVHGTSSQVGVNRLNDARLEDRPGRLALSDGLVAESGFSNLVARPLAVVPFTFVVNNKAPVNQLTRQQARDIFTGAKTRWSEITENPADTEEIRVVGRTGGSGTRRTLERYVLGTRDAPLGQADPTSETCQNRRQGDERARAIVCERDSTVDLLNRVAAVDYSIGYADVPDVKQTPRVKQVGLDGRAATLDGIRAGYPFWTTEYVYSYGPLEADSLAAAFTDYLTSPDGTETVGRLEYFACGPAVTELCASGR